MLISHPQTILLPLKGIQIGSILCRFRLMVKCLLPGQEMTHSSCGMSLPDDISPPLKDILVMLLLCRFRPMERFSPREQRMAHSSCGMLLLDDILLTFRAVVGFVLYRFRPMVRRSLSVQGMGMAWSNCGIHLHGCSLKHLPYQLLTVVIRRGVCPKGLKRVSVKAK